MVFQNYALYPHMKVFDNMAYGLKTRRVAKDEICQRVDKAAAIPELTHDQLSADTLVHGYFSENQTDIPIRLGGIRAFNSGEVLPMCVAADKMHLFAPDTEKRL